MFDKNELDLIDTALTYYWNHLNKDHKNDEAKGRHKTGWQVGVMKRIDALTSKIYRLMNSM